MKIGIFGGTFDPFTIAHLAIVEKVLEDKLVEKVLIVPTVVTWHRAGKKPWLSDVQRNIVINKIIEQSKFKDQIVVDAFDVFCVKDNFSTQIKDRRFVHTLVDITFRHGIENEYYTIIGTDSLKSFNKWWKHDVILSLSKLIAVSGRNGEVISNDAFGAKIVEIDEELTNVSATAIREKYQQYGTDAYDIYVNDVIADIKKNRNI